MPKEQRGSVFQVKLNGLKLPAEVEKRISMEVAKTVLGELAKIDLKGDLRVRPGFKLGPEIYGRWIDFIRGGSRIR